MRNLPTSPPRNAGGQPLMNPAGRPLHPGVRMRRKASVAMLLRVFTHEDAKLCFESERLRAIRVRIVPFVMLRMNASSRCG